MEDEAEEPTSQNIISTFDLPVVLVSVCKRAAQDQSQYPVGQLSPQMCEHFGTGVCSVVFSVELFDRVRELSKYDRKLALRHEGRATTNLGDVCDMVGRV